MTDRRPTIAPRHGRVAPRRRMWRAGGGHSQRESSGGDAEPRPSESAGREVVADVDGREGEAVIAAAPSRRARPRSCSRAAWAAASISCQTSRSGSPSAHSSARWDRAGVGASGPPAKTPRPVSELVADLDSFVHRGGRPPAVSGRGSLHGRQRRVHVRAGASREGGGIRRDGPGAARIRLPTSRPKRSRPRPSRAGAAV